MIAPGLTLLMLAGFYKLLKHLFVAPAPNASPLRPFGPSPDATELRMRLQDLKEQYEELRAQLEADDEVDADAPQVLFKPSQSQPLREFTSPSPITRNGQASSGAASALGRQVVDPDVPLSATTAQRDSVATMAKEVEQLSERSSYAERWGSRREALAASAAATRLLSEIAGVVHRARPQRQSSQLHGNVGLLWPNVGEDWEAWEPSYEGPFTMTTDDRFCPLDVFDGLRKLLYASRATHRVGPEFHELLLAGTRFPGKAKHEQEPWIAIVSLRHVTAILRSDPHLSTIRCPARSLP